MKNNVHEMPSRGEPLDDYEKKEGESVSFPKTKAIADRELGMTDERLVAGKIRWLEENEPENKDLTVLRAVREIFKKDIDLAKRTYEAWTKAQWKAVDAKDNLRLLEEQIIEGSRGNAAEEFHEGA